MEKGELGGAQRKQVPPTPPRMTKADWAKRDKTHVTLTRSDLEYIGQLIAAGRVLLRDNRAVSPQLKAAMTKLGISTQGL
jgi:hypothetical protein